MLFKFYDIVKQSLRTLLVQVLPILLLSACSSDEAKDDLNTKEGLAQQYINLTITVSSSQQEGTRANGDNDASAGNTSAEATRGPRPLGGEDGDGRENGLDAENYVRGITLILADGPLSNDEAKIAFIKYYGVTEMEDTETNIEKKYTTGNQPVKVSELNLTENKTYYIYVVANHNIVANIGDNLSTIRDYRLDFGDLFTGDVYAPDGCQNFVMASEQDVTVNFKTALNIELREERNAAYYTLTKPIIIERLAARLDFCTAYDGNSKNADYGKYDVDGEDSKKTTVTGFKYNTTPGDGYFILESIIPFNIYNEQQYLFKNEVDPNTLTGKSSTESNTLKYVSRLAVDMSSEWERTAENLNIQDRKTTVTTENDKDDNFVLAYCMENILLHSSPLKNYATGLVIKGSYYDKNGKYLTRKTFYEYLRHQGNSATYTPTELTEKNLAEDTRTGDENNNFSIVRNNIYRVNIEKVDSRGNISVKLAVKDWREVEHPNIYL